MRIGKQIINLSIMRLITTTNGLKYPEKLLNELSSRSDSTAVLLSPDSVELLVRPATGSWIDVYTVVSIIDQQLIKSSAEVAINHGYNGDWLFAYLDWLNLLPKDSVVYDRIRKRIAAAM